MAKKPPKAPPPVGINAALSALRARFGKRPLFTTPVRRFIPMKQRALGALLSGEETPGLPSGCFIEVLGREHSGKTTLAFAFVEAVVSQPSSATRKVLSDSGFEEQPAPRRVLYVDSEQSLDTAYLLAACPSAVLAVSDNSGRVTNAASANVYVFQPDSLEDGGDVMVEMIRSGAVDLVVLDSVAAMTPSEETEKTMGQSTVGALARSMSKFFRVTAPVVRKFGVTVVLINQWRNKIGVSFGDPRTAPGGLASSYWDAIKLDVFGPSSSPYFPGNGKVARIKSLKNKVTGRLGLVEYHLERGRGLSYELELLLAGVQAGVITNRGVGSPVVVLPRRDGKVLKCFRKFPNVPAWCEGLRADPSLYSRVWEACGAAGVALPSGGNGGFGDEA